MIDKYLFFIKSFFRNYYYCSIDYCAKIELKKVLVGNC